MERGTTRHARVFCSTIAGDIATLSPEESHYLKHVLRRKPGDEVFVFDGVGHEWAGSLLPITDDRHAQISLRTSRTPVAEPIVSVVLAMGLLKNDAMSEVVRDATMLGVAVIQPFVGDHTALPAVAARSRMSDRWARVALASAKQCGRAVIPRVLDVVTFDVALRAAAETRLICVEPRAGHAASVVETPAPSSVLLLVGPEGGWSSDELAAARDAGALPLSLGPRTLRAEMAPAIALASLWTRLGWP
jgi:16S rRNA (uracil1498-N3)-methyltransferase